MSTNHTPNYQLSQWEKSDQVLMEDFNADNAKLDAAIWAVEEQVNGKAAQSALASEISSRVTAVSALNAAVNRRGNCEIQLTPYTGDGATTRTFSFSAVPKFILVTGPQAVAFYAGNRGVSIVQSSTSSPGPSSFGLNWSGSQLTIAFSTAKAMMNEAKSEYQMISFYDMS